MLAVAALSFAVAATAPTLRHIVNLDYSNGTISVFKITGERARLTYHFGLVAPGAGGPNGLAVLPPEHIYTAIDSSTGYPCSSCFEELRLDGVALAQVAAPTLPSAPGAPDLTDISVDRAGDVFLSDYGQQAVYYFTPTQSGFGGPNIVAENSQNAASVAVSPSAQLAFVSGGCGFASVRTYTRQPSGGYQAGGCFGIGTIALIGGAADDAGDVFTPVDGAFGLVSISNPDGQGEAFAIPDPMGAVSGVALSIDQRILYVADHSKEVVYAFARPRGGWLQPAERPPKHIATYTGFKSLDIIAALP